jgi:TonB family protein
MITWWHYLLLVNLYLVLFFGFYKILLGKETFFQLNRIYLVAGSLLSFLIPLMRSNWIRQLFITQQIHQKIYASVGPEFIYQIKPVESNPVTLGQIIAVIYLAGAVVLSGRLVYQLLLLKKLINKKDAQSAFSFFKNIRVDDNLPNQQTIIEHEEVHIRQWHSADVLLIEAVMIINWFNPVVYLYRKAIKHVHEFIADRKAIQNGTPRAEYALLLLSQTFGTNPHQLTNNFFNHSLLKQRIKMLGQDDSSRRALLKYGLSAPLFAVMLVFSSATVNNSNLINIINNKTDQALSINTAQLKKTLSETKTDDAVIEKEIVATKLKNHLRNLRVKTTLPVNTEQQQSNVVPYDQSAPIFNAVEINPTFPGGQAGFGEFLRNNVRYPAQAKENHVTGRVFIQFTVERDGSLSNIKTLRDPGSGLGEEAERVLALSPKWIPGIQNGRSVRVQYTVPVNFQLTDEVGRKMGTDTIGTHRASNKETTNANANYKLAILLNGTMLSTEDINKINPNSIKSIQVFKGDSSKKYGDIAKNGIAILKLKDEKNP